MNYQERLFRQTNGWGCEPSTALLAASLAISAATAVTTVVAQKQQADAQVDQQVALVEANNAVASDQASALRSQQAQDAESVARETERARLASQKARATATVAAGEAGVTGNSVDALLTEYNAQLGQFREATNRQQQLKTAGYSAQIEALKTGTRFQNLQINAPVAGPNYAAAGLNFAGNAMGAYRAYNPDVFRRGP